jgi:hypothetical protein
MGAGTLTAQCFIGETKQNGTPKEQEPLSQYDYEQILPAQQSGQMLSIL